MIWNIRNILATILNLILGIVTFFIGFRILFQLFAANSNTPFVAWIYNISSGFMAPFAGIFPSITLGQTGSVLDVVALITLIAYAIITQLLISLIDGIVRSSTPTTYTTHERVV